MGHPVGEGPSRGLLCDYESSDGPSFQALLPGSGGQRPGASSRGEESLPQAAAPEVRAAAGLAAGPPPAQLAAAEADAAADVGAAGRGPGG